MDVDIGAHEFPTPELPCGPKQNLPPMNTGREPTIAQFEPIFGPLSLTWHSDLVQTLETQFQFMKNAIQRRHPE